jgi:hypothetical protein
MPNDPMSLMTQSYEFDDSMILWALTDPIIEDLTN